MSQRSVLRVNSVEETAAYREAVAEILRNILNDHGTVLVDIAEAIDVSLGTISNAFNKKSDLSPTYLARLGQRYGPHTLDPFARLIGGRVVPVEAAGTDDVLPFIAMANYRVAQARSPMSPGGMVETLGEQLAMLPDLRALRRELDALIGRIEDRRAAA
jgi:hypothetical protein